MDVLDDARLKVLRANTHIKALQRSIALHFKSNKYIVSHENDGDTQSFFVGRDQKPPMSWGLIAGDIFANLRASLDYIIWGLSMFPNDRKISEGEYRSISFPVIFGNRNDGLIDQRLTFVPSEVKDGIWEIVDALQPYNRANRPEVDLIRILDELCRFDKHRLITPTFELPALRFGENFSLPPRRFMFDQQRYIFTVPNELLEHDTQLKPDFTVEILWQISNPEGGIPFGFNVNNIMAIHEFIRDDIIPRFASFASHPVYISK